MNIASANVLMDGIGVVVGIVSLALLARTYLCGPEAYRRPLSFLLAGLVSIVVGLLFSLAIPVLHLNHAAMELLHHVFLTAGVSLFVLSGLAFVKTGR